MSMTQEHFFTVYTLFLHYDLIGLVKLTEILKNNPHVNEVEVPEKVGGFEEKEVSEAKEIFEAFRK